MFNRVIKQKYGKDIWNFEIKRSSSFSWHIIVDGANFFKPIIRWKIGNKRSRRISKDTWILDRCLNKWSIIGNLLYL
ncbi:hypothetical protein KFK09_014826 [Dendrobium nobile]|uniref:Uncharacterized protein n=1 Tax=Dendrobium nobile TaxID=94219 RepID=A0A8T3B5I0_DENNO|nr:hypothetical protein KFK09_014826 [Dendrobium nobile]